MASDIRKTIVAISHESIFYAGDENIAKHNHRPYFLAKIKDNKNSVEKLSDSVVEIGPVEKYESTVNWHKEVKVQRVYLTHPSVTPAISTEYYKAGYETYEQGVPYIQRVICDLCAEGKWPLNTYGNEQPLKCIIYDFEVIDGIAKCCGIGKFSIYIKTNVNLDKEDFDISFRIDENITVEQFLADNIYEERDNVLIPLIREMKKSDIIIGHNIAGFDNKQLIDRLNAHKINHEIKQFLEERVYTHQVFYRGRRATATEIYPISFDTLLAARFLFKNLADGMYGLKRLGPYLNIDVTQYEGRSKLYKKRVYERDFNGFGNWSNNDDICLQYNKDDIYETYGVFRRLYKEIITYMFTTAMPFQDVVSNSNVKMADYMTLIRSYKKYICPPVIEPFKVARSFYDHFHGKLYSKREIFEFFINHECTNTCLDVLKNNYSANNGYFTDTDNNDTDTDKTEINTDDNETETDIEIDIRNSESYQALLNKVLRCVKYGDEMPAWVEYYPLIVNFNNTKREYELGYLSVGGYVFKPERANACIVPFHDVYKGDVSAQYPTILKAKNIDCYSVRLAAKDEEPDGWCWFREIKNKQILEKFNYKPAKDLYFTDGEGYVIGYKSKGVEGVITKALTGIIKIVSKYKKMPGYEDVYQLALKPARNALTHGVLLAADATGMQFNIAGCAIPTLGQEITNQMIKHLTENNWRLLESDTDGSEFIIQGNCDTDFQKLVSDVEEYWQKILNYELKFDVEKFNHKIYTSHKNYISIINDKVKLTGATFKASDKAALSQRIMKELMLEILPKTNTQEEFMSSLLSTAKKVIDNSFKNINNDELVLVESIKPKSEYSNEDNVYRQRTQAIENLLKREIDFPTKLELYVCKERLPGTIGPKTLSKPISFMWPREIIDDNNSLGGGIDYEWYKHSTIAYIDAAFSLKNVSVGQSIRNLSMFDNINDELQHIEVKKVKPYKGKSTLDGFIDDEIPSEAKIDFGRPKLATKKPNQKVLF